MDKYKLDLNDIQSSPGNNDAVEKLIRILVYFDLIYFYNLIYIYSSLKINNKVV